VTASGDPVKVGRSRCPAGVWTWGSRRWPPARRAGTTLCRACGPEAYVSRHFRRPAASVSLRRRSSETKTRPKEVASEICPRCQRFAGDRLFRQCDRRRKTSAARPEPSVSRVHGQLQLTVLSMLKSCPAAGTISQIQPDIDVSQTIQGNRVDILQNNQPIQCRLNCTSQQQTCWATCR
jgi:hypothetical protein